MPAGRERKTDDFDIRAWGAAHGWPERIDDPAVIDAVIALLRRDLEARLAAHPTPSEEDDI
jgi:hypothetical protein